MPKITFTHDYRPKGDDPAIPTYKAGESHDFDLSYAEKYKRIGVAVDYVAPQPKHEPVIEVKPDLVPEVEVKSEDDVAEAPAPTFHRPGSRRR